MVREEFHVTSIVLYKDSPLPFSVSLGFPMDTLSRALVFKCLELKFPMLGCIFLSSHGMKHASFRTYIRKTLYLLKPQGIP